MAKASGGKRMMIVSVHVPLEIVNKIDELIKEGRFVSRSDAIRTLLRFGIMRLENLREQSSE